MRGALLAFALTMAVTVAHAARPGTIVIDNDGGGSVDTYFEFFSRIKDAEIPVRLEGMCISACTFVFMLPMGQWCVTENVSFGFHLAHAGGMPLPGYTAQLMRRVYPKKLLAWLHGKEMKMMDMLPLLAEEAVGLGVARYCEDVKHDRSNYDE